MLITGEKVRTTKSRLSEHGLLPLRLRRGSHQRGETAQERAVNFGGGGLGQVPLLLLWIWKSDNASSRLLRLRRRIVLIKMQR